MQEIGIEHSGLFFLRWVGGVFMTTFGVEVDMSSSLSFDHVGLRDRAMRSGCSTHHPERMYNGGVHTWHRWK